MLYCSSGYHFFAEMFKSGNRERILKSAKDRNTTHCKGQKKNQTSRDVDLDKQRCLWVVENDKLA